MFDIVTEILSVFFIPYHPFQSICWFLLPLCFLNIEVTSLRWLFCPLCWSHKLSFRWGQLLGNCDVLEVVVFCGIVCFLFLSARLEEHHLFKPNGFKCEKQSLQMDGRVISMVAWQFCLWRWFHGCKPLCHKVHWLRSYFVEITGIIQAHVMEISNYGEIFDCISFEAFLPLFSV